VTVNALYRSKGAGNSLQELLCTSANDHEAVAFIAKTILSIRNFTVSAL
jgi:hypothetical protein